MFWELSFKTKTPLKATKPPAHNTITGTLFRDGLHPNFGISATGASARHPLHHRRCVTPALRV